MTLYQDTSKLPKWAVKPAKYVNPTSMDVDRDKVVTFV